MIIGSGAQGTPNSFAVQRCWQHEPGHSDSVQHGKQLLPSWQCSWPRSFLGFTYNGPVQHDHPGRFAVQQLAGSASAPVLTRLLAPGVLHLEQAHHEHQFARSWRRHLCSRQCSFGRRFQQRSARSSRQQYGLAAFNRPQRLIIAYSYDLPYRNRQGFAGHVFGGWTVSGVTTFQDGEPFTVIDGNGGTIFGGAGGFGGGGVRAELNPANTGKCNSSASAKGSDWRTTEATEFPRSSWVDQSRGLHFGAMHLEALRTPLEAAAASCGAFP